MQTAIYLSFITASISFTVTETKLFKRLREWVKERNAFFGELLHCGYCFGHWVAFALVAIYQPKVVAAWPPLDYFLTALLIAWFSGIQWVLMCWVMAKAGK
jgi:hypothetical protein|uniref:DUF1360 domain-containing protein n=1 Tax=Candidatus Electronema sp. TaxID=2698783 RepID=UPI0040573A56